ncbi:MAG: hypothetical protein ACT4PO_08850 [Actinomycetota bacterium]
MRRLLVPSALLLVVLASCSPAIEGPSETVALEQVNAGPGLNVTAARQAVVAFLEAYAGAAQDGGAELNRLVATEKLARWVKWLAVQHESFPGKITGEFELRGLEFLGTIPAQGSLAAQVDLGATLTVTFEPKDADPIPQTRMLDGPVTLFLRGRADWGIVDITRDGQSMDESIQLFEGVVQSGRRVTVLVDSLFTFPPYWSFNIVIENGSRKAVRFDEREALIAPAEGSELERPLRGRAKTPPLARIAPGTTVEGSINFATPEAAEALNLSIALHLGKLKLVLVFPLSGLISPSPTPSPTGEVPVPEETS